MHRTSACLGSLPDNFLEPFTTSHVTIARLLILDPSNQPLGEQLQEDFQMSNYSELDSASQFPAPTANMVRRQPHQRYGGFADPHFGSNHFVRFAGNPHVTATQPDFSVRPSNFHSLTYGPWSQPRNIRDDFDPRTLPQYERNGQAVFEYETEGASDEEMETESNLFVQPEDNNHDPQGPQVQTHLLTWDRQSEPSTVQAFNDAVEPVRESREFTPPPNIRNVERLGQDFMSHPSRYPVRPKPGARSNRNVQEHDMEPRAATRKKPNANGSRRARRCMPENDPENHLIKDLRSKNHCSWARISELMNERRIGEGKEPSFTEAAVYGRFVRNAPRIAKMEGNTTWDNSDWMYLKKEDQGGSKSHSMEHGEPNGNVNLSFRAGRAGADVGPSQASSAEAIGISVSDSTLLTECFLDSQTAFWTTVRNQYEARSSQGISPANCQRLCEALGLKFTR